MDLGWKNSTPEVSFVIPSYASLPTIEKTIESIHTQSSSLSREILVVNSSLEGLDTSLKSLYPNVNIIQVPTQLWPGAARNLGAKTARGEWLAFVDADAVLEKNWLECLHSMLLENPLAAAGGWIMNGKPAENLSSVLHWIQFSEFLPDQRSSVRSFISSSNLLINRKQFLRSGGFDERLRMSEDSAFCLGYSEPLLFCSDTGIRHYSEIKTDRVKKYLQTHGKWSGQYRSLYPASSSFLFQSSTLTRLLPLWRLILIMWRVHRTGGSTEKPLYFLPALYQCLVFWSHGFETGLKSNGKNLKKTES